MPIRKPCPTEMRGGLIRWYLGIALVMYCGCAAPLAMDQPAPLARVYAKAKQIVQRPNHLDPNTQPSSEPARPVPLEPANKDPVRLNAVAPANSVTPAVSQLSFQDPQNGQYAVMQVGYQAPMGRTYVNPPHPPPQNYAPHYPGYQNTVPQNMNFQQGQFSRGYAPQSQSYQALIQQPSPNPAAPVDPAQLHHPNRPQPQGPQETPMMPRRPFNENAAPIQSELIMNTSPPSFDRSPDGRINDSIQPMGENGGSGSGHLADGMNLVGTVLRQPHRTATELALELKNELAQLREKLKLANLKAERLAADYETQKMTLQDSRELLTKSNRLAALLREKIATLNVEVQDLKQEKILVEQDADKALKEIESKLDSMLLNSISKSNK